MNPVLVAAVASTKTATNLRGMYSSKNWPVIRKSSAAYANKKLWAFPGIESYSLAFGRNKQQAGFSYRFGSPSGRIIAKPFRLTFRTPFSPGRCPGLLSCCTFGAQNLEPHVPAPFALWPTPIQPNLQSSCSSCRG